MRIAVFLVPGLVAASGILAPSDEMEAVAHEVFLATVERPMGLVMGKLMGMTEKASTLYDCHASLGKRKLSIPDLLDETVDKSRLRALVTSGVSDLDLMFESRGKLSEVFGHVPGEIDDLLKTVGVGALEKLDQIQGAVPTGRYAMLRLHAIYALVRSRVNRILATAQAPQLVRMENEQLLRFALGPVEATRLLLDRGIHVLVDNTHQNAAIRKEQKFSEQLAEPLSKLRALARQLSCGQKRMFIGVYRPMFEPDLVFLVGEERTRNLMAGFAEEYASYLLAMGFDKLSGWKRERDIPWIREKLEENVRSPDRRFDVISLANRDRLTALIGSLKATELLSLRARWVLDQLSNSDAEFTAHILMHRQAVRDDILGFCGNLIENLHTFPGLANAKTVAYIAFFVGAGPADVMAAKGFNSLLEVKAGKTKDGAKGEPQLWSAFEVFYPRHRLENVLRAAVADELRRIELQHGRENR